VPLVPVARTRHHTVPGESWTVGVACRFVVVVDHRRVSKELEDATWMAYVVPPATRFQVSTGVPLTAALAAFGVRPPGATGAADAWETESKAAITAVTSAVISIFLVRESENRR
jgi:hypothetical protein